MATQSRGRGYAMKLASNEPMQPLRKPGEFGLKQRLATDSTSDKSASADFNQDIKLSPNNIEEKNEDKVLKLCDKISGMTLSDPVKEFKVIESEVLSLCNTSNNLQGFVDKIVSYALLSKWNTHAIALFCENHIDVTTEGMKLRTLLLRKLQSLYLERNKKYLNLDKFFMDVTFICEIFHHVKIDGNCIQVLAHPITDYFAMLLDGGSQKEIELFYEQFPRCYKNLRTNDASGFENLLIKIRKQIVSETTRVADRAMLLAVFEFLLTDWQPLTQSVTAFYDTFLKPIVRICE